MTDENTMPPRARRQASAGAVAGREASAFVRDLNRQLGQWQASSVKLHTMAERMRATGRDDPSLPSEIRGLFDAVQAEAQRFEERVATQSPEVAGHGRIGDTRKSFEMISGRLRQSLRLLGEHEGEE